MKKLSANERKAAAFRKAAALIDGRRERSCCAALYQALPKGMSYDDLFEDFQQLMGQRPGEFWWPDERSLPMGPQREHLAVSPRVTALELVALVLEERP